MNDKKSIANVFESVLFLLYFVVLTVERTISLVAAFSYGIAEMGALDVYMTVITIAALVCGWAYLVIFGRKLFRFASDKTGADFKHPSIAAGIILVGGMVHTIGTIPPVQFAAYGCLLAAMAIFTARRTIAGGNAPIRWLTFAYTVAFSMAIPVVYIMGCEHECPTAAAFYPIECITSVALVALFTVMLVKFYDTGAIGSFCPFVWIFAAIADAAVIGLRWHDEINMFVLIFASLALVLGIVGKCVVHFGGKKQARDASDISADD